MRSNLGVWFQFKKYIIETFCLYKRTPQLQYMYNVLHYRWLPPSILNLGKIPRDLSSTIATTGTCKQGIGCRPRRTGPPPLCKARPAWRANILYFNNNSAVAILIIAGHYAQVGRERSGIWAWCTWASTGHHPPQGAGTKNSTLCCKFAHTSETYGSFQTRYLPSFVPWLMLSPT